MKINLFPWRHCIIALFLLALPAAVQAQFTFTTNNGAITIAGYTGSGGAVAIPSTTNGYPVTGIGQYAFEAANVTSVTIPGSVTNIAQDSFEVCQGLTNIVIPNSVISIGQSAFLDCTSLASATLPGNLTSIADSTFENCTNLANIVIPNSVTMIGAFAFYDCALTNVVIPGSVTNIGIGGFEYCTSLTNISVIATNPAYSSTNGILFDKKYDTLIQYPAGLMNSYAIPNGVTNIAQQAFFRCAGLTGVSIPNSVTSIGAAAFFDCTNLTSITIPASVTSLGDQAFQGCTSLTSAYFQSSAPGEPLQAFADDPTAIVYYLPGTTGWGTVYGGAPPVLWNPQATTFVTAGNQFGFNITGPTNLAIVVEACTNLANPVWLPASTNTLSGSGTSSFSDPQQGNFPRRYYRFSAP